MLALPSFWESPLMIFNKWFNILLKVTKGFNIIGLKKKKKKKQSCWIGNYGIKRPSIYKISILLNKFTIFNGDTVLVSKWNGFS